MLAAVGVEEGGEGGGRDVDLVQAALVGPRSFQASKGVIWSFSRLSGPAPLRALAKFVFGLFLRPRRPWVVCTVVLEPAQR